MLRGRKLRELLEKLKKGQISINEAERLLKILAIQEVGNIARIDINREFRKGIPEVIFAERKTSKEVVEIALSMVNRNGSAIISRISKEQIKAIKKVIPKDTFLQVYEKAKIAVVKKKDFKVKKTGGKVGILTAGTSDIPVAEEARLIVEEMGCEVITAYDVGVAGIHRLLSPLEKMVRREVDVVIVVAGREGALPSVVAGLIDVPIIAVPTSIGYGYGEKGKAALMAMLQACPLGLAVVNIDGGVAAGAIATLIANRVAKFRR